MTIPNTNEIVVVIGAGSIAQAITRRIGVSKTILLADINEDAAKAAAQTLDLAGFHTSTAHVDVASAGSVRALADTAAQLGTVVHVVHTAGLSPAQASPQAIIDVDLVGVAYVLEQFGRVIAAGGSGIVIASQAGHMLPQLPGRAEPGSGQYSGRGAHSAAVPPARRCHQLGQGLRARQARQ